MELWRLHGSNDDEGNSACLSRITTQKVRGAIALRPARPSASCATLNGMDANGARALLARIELDHWQQADGVRDGRLPDVDPDADRLVGVDDDLRVYKGGAEKRLTGGVWAPAMLERVDAAA